MTLLKIKLIECRLKWFRKAFMLKKKEVYKKNKAHITHLYLNKCVLKSYQSVFDQYDFCIDNQCEFWRNQCSGQDLKYEQFLLSKGAQYEPKNLETGRASP